MDNEQIMIDFSAYIQSDWAWIVLFVMAIFVGMSKTIIRLLPMAIVGFFLAIWVDNMIPATEFKHLMGVCLALVLAVMLWSQWKGKENLLIDKWWYSPLLSVTLHPLLQVILRSTIQ